MTNEDSQIVTMLCLKYGGWEGLLDMWLYSDEALSPDEVAAVDAWLATEQVLDLGITLRDTSKAKGYKYLSAEIAIKLPKKD